MSLIHVTTIVSPPFEENTFIVRREGRPDCVVVDPGTLPDRIMAEMERQGVEPAALLITHGHGDHIAGNAALKARWPAVPIVIGRGDAPKLGDPVLNVSAPFGLAITSPPADVLLDDGDLYSAAGLDFESHEIPGHSSGHIVFILREHAPPLVFGGDVLFAGSIGRTDFPGGSFEQLAAGIERHLFTLPPESQVYSGHGPRTTIGVERRSNPFVGERARGRRQRD